MFATQRPLTLDELALVLAPIGRPTDERMLSGGTFSAVQSVDLADGSTVVVKTSVPDALLDARAPLLTYEHSLLATERDVIRAVSSLPAVPAPSVLLEDFTREHVEVDALVTELLPGTQWDVARPTMSDAADEATALAVGRAFAAMHRIDGPSFGYPAAGFRLGASDWPTAFGAMMDALLADAQVWGVDVRADDVRAAVERGADALAEVETPCLVHMDLWPGNVLVEPATGHVHGIVDFERALFADPIAEFVGAESMTTGATRPELWRGYLDAGGALPIDERAGTASRLTPTADYRTTLYRLYMTTIMQIEIVPRAFSGAWVADHRAQLIANREVLLERAALGY